MRLTIGCVAIVLGIGAALARAQAPDNRLTIADVEKVSGLKGVTQAAKASKPGAGGNLNFLGPEWSFMRWCRASATRRSTAQPAPCNTHSS